MAKHKQESNAMDKVFDRYVLNQTKWIGTQQQCAVCLTLYAKKTQTHSFCSNDGPGNCKSIFWSMRDVDDVRMRDVVKKHNARLEDQHRQKQLEHDDDPETNMFVTGQRIDVKREQLKLMIDTATGEEVKFIARLLNYKG